MAQKYRKQYLSGDQSQHLELVRSSTWVNPMHIFIAGTPDYLLLDRLTKKVVKVIEMKSHSGTFQLQTSYKWQLQGYLLACGVDQLQLITLQDDARRLQS